MNFSRTKLATDDFSAFCYGSCVLGLDPRELYLPADRWIPHDATSLSPDRTRLFVGLRKLAERNHSKADQILVIDTGTGQQLTTITTSQPFWSLTVDTVNYEVSEATRNIGETPTEMLTSPLLCSVQEDVSATRRRQW